MNQEVQTRIHEAMLAHQEETARLSEAFNAASTLEAKVAHQENQIVSWSRALKAERADSAAQLIISANLEAKLAQVQDQHSRQMATIVDQIEAARGILRDERADTDAIIAEAAATTSDQRDKIESLEVELRDQTERANRLAQSVPDSNFLAQRVSNQATTIVELRSQLRTKEAWLAQLRESINSQVKLRFAVEKSRDQYRKLAADFAREASDAEDREAKLRESLEAILLAMDSEKDGYDRLCQVWVILRRAGLIT